MHAEYVSVGVCECVCGWVGGCADGSWEADTVQENRPLATDLFWADGASRATATQHHNGRGLLTSPSLHHPPTCHNLSRRREGKDTRSHTALSSSVGGGCCARFKFGQTKNKKERRGNQGSNASVLMIPLLSIGLPAWSVSEIVVETA